MSQEQAVFSLDKIYVKDISLEVPNAPKIFLNREQPSIELNLSFRSEKVDGDVHQTILHATINAKANEEQMFLIEIEQVGIFQMRNIPEEQMELVYNIECPTILFPYLRETVTDLTTKAGFLPVILTPVNFAYLHHQKHKHFLNF